MFKNDAKLNEFFSSFFREKSFLLAFSGGPDSTYLFYVLLSYGINFEVAHVNHGWRKESDQEVRILQKLCQEKNIEFHLKVLCQNDFSKGNLENIARGKRYSFFKEVCISRGHDGIMLAHHADDKVETVLKRIFEGANLWNMEGIKEKKQLCSNLFLFRPLLHLTKKQIICHLEAHKISYFVDSSNKDKKFLRARLRETVIPFLEKEFGKNIRSSFLRIASYSEDLFNCLFKELETYKNQIDYQENKIIFNFKETFPEDDFIWGFLLKNFFLDFNLTPSDNLVKVIIYHLKKKNKSKVLRLHDKIIKMDRGYLILFV